MKRKISMILVALVVALLGAVAVATPASAAGCNEYPASNTSNVDHPGYGGREMFMTGIHKSPSCGGSLWVSGFTPVNGENSFFCVMWFSDAAGDNPSYPYCNTDGNIDDYNYVTEGSDNHLTLILAPYFKLGRVDSFTGNGEYDIYFSGSSQP